MEKGRALFKTQKIKKYMRLNLHFKRFRDGGRGLKKLSMREVWIFAGKGLHTLTFTNLAEVEISLLHC